MSADQKQELFVIVCVKVTGEYDFTREVLKAPSLPEAKKVLEKIASRGGNAVILKTTPVFGVQRTFVLRRVAKNPGSRKKITRAASAATAKEQMDPDAWVEAAQAELNKLKA